VRGAHVFLELHQEALIADVSVQRKERLHLVKLVGRQKALAQRRHAEIGKGMLQRLGADAAGSTIVVCNVMTDEVTCMGVHV